MKQSSMLKRQKKQEREGVWTTGRSKRNKQSREVQNRQTEGRE